MKISSQRTALPLCLLAVGLVACPQLTGFEDDPTTTDPRVGGPGGGGILIPPGLGDVDGDAILDGIEDRDQDGVVDPGETDPNSVDSDGDGIPDINEVQTLACSKQNDRPFEVYDAPGANSMILVDARVTVFSTIRDADGLAPGLAIADPEADVAGVMIKKVPDRGVATPSAQRDIERRTSIAALGNVVGQQTRSFVTVEGFTAEQATFQIQTSGGVDARSAANKLAQEMLGGGPLTGTLAAGGTQGRALLLKLLTIYRSPTEVVLVAGVAVGENPLDRQVIRIEEFTDGTNVARHGSFTRHVCDGFKAEAQSKADIIFVVDDSGSMEDDQQAVRDAAAAMETVLASAQVDFRLGVTRTRAREDGPSSQRGNLEGPGMTSDIEEFKNTIVVGASGGWEPGLETGILAIDRLLPRTAAGAPVQANKLREDAATVIIHMSDERDQTVECMACGGCDAEESTQTFCTDPAAGPVVDNFIEQYTARNAVTFAIVGDLPNGCQQQTGNRDDFEPGQGYVEVANATGGQFGSLCGDMTQNLQDVARVATGVASSYRLSTIPASASIQVAVGPPGSGRIIPRSRTNGFDYDAVQNSVVFYGDARPTDGEEVVIGYRRWDWRNNENRPVPKEPFAPLPDGSGYVPGGSGPNDGTSGGSNPDGSSTTNGDPDYPTSSSQPPYEGCDDCSAGTSCNPESDLVDCIPICGDQICQDGAVCLLDVATCGSPGDDPNSGLPGTDAPNANGCGGGCGNGMVCDVQADQCVTQCESSGCGGGQICNEVTHLCEIPNF